jgi:coniferyl-aldehyde dehydrogenase
MKLTDLNEIQRSSVTHMQNVFVQQRNAFDATPYPELAYRRDKLIKLRKQIIRYQDVIAKAISQDFDSRSIEESKLLDLLGSVLEAEHAIKHVQRWMRPSRRHAELLFFLQ